MLKDERGVTLLLTVLVMSFLLIMAGIGADLARVWVAREDMQAAVDAASLAGARNAVRYVTVSVLPGHLECDEDSCYCVSDPPIVDRSGTERYMIEQGGWGDECDDYMGIRHRWLRYPSDTQEIAEGVLEANWPSLLTPSAGGSRAGAQVKVYGTEGDPHYPSVQAKGEGSIKPVLLKLAGISDLTVKQCGQSSSFYNRVVEGIVYGRFEPQDSCR